MAIKHTMTYNHHNGYRYLKVKEKLQFTLSIDWTPLSNSK